ncbi:MAG TPA: RNA polymerase factor sigma-54 [Gemmatimonadetes bacterium]|jgi:RNA polymerase sigma-54 factor|nr:RNA polymerase factor sigma-54 [Gemmatimonadota bacterium]
MGQFNIKLYQSAQLRQEMRANPRLYQAMELVYMPVLDLQQHLKQEIEGNPFLELTEAEIDQEIELEEDDPDEPLGDDTDWAEVLLNDDYRREGQREQFEKKEFFEPAPVDTRDLKDHLNDQLRFLSLPERNLRMGEEIIGNIDDDGMLACELSEVVIGVNGWLDELRPTAIAVAQQIEDAEQQETETEEILEIFQAYNQTEAIEMLEVIQSFDPAGVGSRDVRESILIQLGRLGKSENLSYQLVENHFDSLSKHRWNEIANEIGVDPVQVQAAADEIKALDAKPGDRYAPTLDHRQNVIPDLVVRERDGKYVVEVNDTGFPGLRVAESTRALVRDKAKLSSEDKEFIAKNYNSATWMVQAVEQRRQTMLKVMNFIVDKQMAFFEKGVQSLKPLTLREVADHIEMHESTVSRVTNKKYVQTPRGVYSLKYFFSSGISTTSGEATSSRGVKDRIKSHISNEDPLKPLTDQAIVRLLVIDGIKIARRTVAKYREQLGILSARMRKRV